MVMGTTSNSRGCRFESQHQILDGHFSHLIAVKIEMVVLKEQQQAKKRHMGVVQLFISCYLSSSCVGV